MKKYQVRLRGVAPILHGRKDPRGNPPRGGAEKEKFYGESWAFTNYKNADGILGEPSHILKSTLVAGLRATAKSGDSEAGKGKTQMMARAGLLISPAFPLFNSGAQMVDNPPVLGPAEAFALMPEDEPKVFVLKRLCDRGVEITNLAINGWELEFYLTDISNGYFNADWLKRGLEYAFTYIGAGTWRPEFGRAAVTEFAEVEI